jgi:hypothetical protein
MSKYSLRVDFMRSGVQKEMKMYTTTPYTVWQIQAPDNYHRGLSDFGIKFAKTALCAHIRLTTEEEQKCHYLQRDGKTKLVRERGVVHVEHGKITGLIILERVGLQNALWRIA